MTQDAVQFLGKFFAWSGIAIPTYFMGRQVTPFPVGPFSEAMEDGRNKRFP